MIEKLYTVEEVAELASVTGRTIRNYLKSGRLVGRKIGGQWRFPEAEVQRLLTGAPPEPAAAASDASTDQPAEAAATPSAPAAATPPFSAEAGYSGAPAQHAEVPADIALPMEQTLADAPANTAPPAAAQAPPVWASAPTGVGDAPAAMAQVPAAQTSQPLPPAMPVQAPTNLANGGYPPVAVPAYPAATGTAPQWPGAATSGEPVYTLPTQAPGGAYPSQASQTQPPVAQPQPYSSAPPNVETTPPVYPAASASPAFAGELAPATPAFAPQAAPVQGQPAQQVYTNPYGVYAVPAPIPAAYPPSPSGTGYPAQSGYTAGPAPTAASHPVATPATPVAPAPIAPATEQYTVPPTAYVQDAAPIPAAAPAPPAAMPQASEAEHYAQPAAPSVNTASPTEPQNTAENAQSSALSANQIASAAPKFSDVGKLVTRFISEVHDCAHGPEICTVMDLYQPLQAAKQTSERLSVIADEESENGQLCQCFVEYDERFYVARYTLFGSSAFLMRCLKLLG